MMHLFINSLAASAGGGLTYIRNVLPHLSAQPGIKLTVALNPALREEFCGFSNVDFLSPQITQTRRFWYEQSELPRLIRRCDADVLLSTGNFALRRSPVPQILLSRNSVYTSADFYRDLLSRREYFTWVDTHLRAVLARKSIQWADVTVAPSQAFADELQRWTGARVLAIHHGFDQEAFCQESGPLAPDTQEKLNAVDGCLKLLFVSHYNYYRNFETLLRALPNIQERLAGRPLKLLLTCHLAPGKNPGAYRTDAAAALVRTLALSEMVVELGAIPYRQLHLLYPRADIYVTPAYTETFAHPLVEAMACGLPVVASDLAVHREICRDAALYFPRFGPDELAERIELIASRPEQAERMSTIGRTRAREFSWKTHVAKIVELARNMAGPSLAQSQPAV